MTYILDFGDIDAFQVALAGGKGANLGALSRISGLHVPTGFCVTTSAFRRVLSASRALDQRIDRLSGLRAHHRREISMLCAELRTMLATVTVPDDLAHDIGDALRRHGEHARYAVRSSTTSEDSPTASFAGQQNSYLNILGTSAIVEHVRLCWAALFDERVVTYRIHNDLPHTGTHPAALVQRMVFPQSAGNLFTADPLTCFPP